MKVSKSSGGGAWIDKKTLRNGDLIKIVSEAGAVESQQGGTQLVAKVRVKGSAEGAQNLAINSPTKNALIEAYGDDTADWQDKVLVAHIEKTVIAGKRGIALYLVPEGFEVGEDTSGYIVVVPKGSSSFPAGTAKTEEEEDEPSQDINPDDIPF